MIKQGHIGTVELFAILLAYEPIAMFYNLPNYLAQRAATGAWILNAFTDVTGLMLFVPVYLLMKRFPGKSIVEIAGDLLGRPGSFICGLLIGAFYFYVFRHFLVVYGDVVISTVLLSTPLYAVLLLAIMMCIVVSYLGLEGLTRTALIFTPFTIFGIFVVIGLSIPGVDFDGLFPILGVPLWDHVKNAGQLAPVLHDTLFLSLWAPYIRTEKGLFKLVLWAFVAIAVLNVGLVMLVQTVFPYPQDMKLPFPVYQAARMIYFSRFIQRVEALMVILAVVETSIHLCTVLLNCVLAFSQGLKLTDWRPIIFPIVVTAFALAFLPQNIIELARWFYSVPNSLINLCFTLVFPLILYILAIVKGKKGGKKLETETS